MHKPLAALALTATVLLTACLVPERFAATVTVQRDASFGYRFDGTVVNAMAVMKLRKQGVLSAKDRQNLAAQTQEFSKDPDVKKALYSGNARYALEVEGQRKAGETLRLLDMFMVHTDTDGVMTIAARQLKDKERNDLSHLGIHVSGTLKVNIPGNAEVISHNASSTPTLGLGSYGWKIDNLSAHPEIKLRIKP